MASYTFLAYDVERSESGRVTFTLGQIQQQIEIATDWREKYESNPDDYDTSGYLGHGMTKIAIYVCYSLFSFYADLLILVWV